MALPPSGPLSINMIRNELGQSSGSLGYLSSLVGFTTPYAISKFYGYNPTPPLTLRWYNSSYFSGFGCTLNLYVNGTNRVSDYVNSDDHTGTISIAPGDTITVYYQGSGGNYAYLYSHALLLPSNYVFSQGTVDIDPYLYYTFTAGGTGVEVIGFVDYP